MAGACVGDGLSDITPPVMPNVVSFRPPAWRRVYGLAVAAACFEYSLYSE